MVTLLSVLIQVFYLMKNRKLVIYGNGDLGALMSHYFKTDSYYEVVAFSADKKYITEPEIKGIPVVPFEEVQEKYPSSDHDMFVAMGYTCMRAREKMYIRAKEAGYTLASYISSKAIVDTTNVLGDNNAILQGAVLEPFSIIGSNNVVYTNAVICHHAVVGSHNFLAAQVLIGGCSTVGDLCFFGFKATVLQKLQVADETLVGAHSLLRTNTDPCTLYIGCPATEAGEHSEQGVCVL